MPQIALITGGSAGIGQAAAFAAAERGFGVIFTYYRHQAEARETVQKIEAAGGGAAELYLDVADTNSFAQFYGSVEQILRDKWKTSKLHALVNNAGIGGGAAFEDVTEESFDQFHQVLFRGPYFLTQRLLPLLADGGAIVNTGSNSALVSGVEAGYSSYASQKAGLHLLTRYWAKELAPRQIRVNAVAPGSTRTRIVDDIFTRMPEVIPPVVETVPFGRLGEPEDIGKVIVFLIDDASAWVTGQVIEASGGQGL
ncbi:SDR family NAD(P)-dependent oxidoreductase [Micromonospora sp. URMC 103]|uniref:SDR family NAD(P)-dependent oxidoreductase n=1 Tax=Micromonospora sp. URMC 103 TaxID=3423406 RepID=UPI003F1CF823